MVKDSMVMVGGRKGGFMTVGMGFPELVVGLEGKVGLRGELGRSGQRECG